MQDYELNAYLGDFVDQVDEDGRDRLKRASDRIAETYPVVTDDNDQPIDDYQDERVTAFSAATQYVFGDLTVDDVAERLTKARIDLANEMVTAREVAIEAIADGATEAGIARSLGLDRMTIRKWLGKR